jgi:hypothetical protein
MCTTVAENENYLNDLFGGVRHVKFMPSIPNLPYQYRLFVNYDPRAQSLNEWNAEIPREFEDMATKSPESGFLPDRGAEAIVVAGGKLSFEEILERELAKGGAHPQVS